MPQLSLYVSDENLAVLRARSEKAGMSMSKYASRLIEQDAQNAGWPKGFWELYGALGEDLEIPDDPPPSDDTELEALFA